MRGIGRKVKVSLQPLSAYPTGVSGQDPCGMQAIERGGVRSLQPRADRVLGKSVEGVGGEPRRVAPLFVPHPGTSLRRSVQGLPHPHPEDQRGKGAGQHDSGHADAIGGGESGPDRRQKGQRAIDAERRRRVLHRDLPRVQRVHQADGFDRSTVRSVQHPLIRLRTQRIADAPGAKPLGGRAIGRHRWITVPQQRMMTIYRMSACGQGRAGAVGPRGGDERGSGAMAVCSSQAVSEETTSRLSFAMLPGIRCR